jgi:hypothetical protein
VVPAGELGVVVALVVHVPAEHHVAEAEAALDGGEELVAVDVLAAQDAVDVADGDLHLAAWDLRIASTISDVRFFGFFILCVSFVLSGPRFILKMADREFDIVIYGATGFVRPAGMRVPRCADGQAEAQVGDRGRDRERLKKVAEKSGGKPKVLVSDSSDAKALDAIAARTRV